MSEQEQAEVKAEESATLAIVEAPENRVAAEPAALAMAEAPENAVAAESVTPPIAEAPESSVAAEPVIAARAEAPENSVAAEVTPEKVEAKPTRPFRVKLRGSVLTLMRLPNRRDVRAAIHQLSTTGGVIHLEKPLDEKIKVEMVFHICEATIRGKAEMLFPMWATQGWMQPFRFIDLPETERQALDANLKSFMGEGARAAAAGR